MLLSKQQMACPYPLVASALAGMVRVVICWLFEFSERVTVGNLNRTVEVVNGQPTPWRHGWDLQKHEAGAHFVLGPFPSEAFAQLTGCHPKQFVLLVVC